MSPEEIQALVQASITEAIGGLKEEFTKANQGLAANLTKELKKVVNAQPQPQPTETESEESNKLSLKSLQQQLADMKNELNNKELETFKAKKAQAISQLIAGTKSNSPSALQKLFTLEYGEHLKEEGGQWYVAKGESVQPLQDALKSYLSTDEGKNLLPPSGVNGAGSIETKPAVIDTNQPIKATDALFNAF